MADTHVKSLQPWHYELILRLVRGATVTEAAKELGKSVHRCHAVYRSPRGQELYKRMQAYRIQEGLEGEGRVSPSMVVFKEAEERAARTIVDLMKSAEKESTALSAASQVIDRVHGKPKQFVEESVLSVSLSKQDAENIAAGLEELGTLSKEEKGGDPDRGTDSQAEDAG